jgi:hypothetical protein
MHACKLAYGHALKCLNGYADEPPPHAPVLAGRLGSDPMGGGGGGGAGAHEGVASITLQI